MNSLASWFGSSSSQTPLIDQPEYPLCSSPQAKKLQRTMLKCACLALTSISVGSLSILDYSCIQKLIASPTPKLEALCTTFFALQAFTAASAACTVYFYCRHRKKVLEQFPHQSAYQGSQLLTTRFDYYIRQGYTRNPAMLHPLLAACLNKLNDLGLLSEWLSLKGYADKKEAIEKTALRIQKGLCYGHSINLLLMMDKFYHLPSSKLLEKLDFESIVYFQFLQEVIYDFAESGNISFLFQQMPYLELGHANQVSILLDLLKHYSVVPTFLSHQTNYYNLPLDPVQLKDSFEVYSTLKNTTFANGKEIFQNFTVVGLISLQESEENRKKPGEHLGHSLFFQLSDHLRFHDSSSTLAGFFEFPNEDLFFDGLAKHTQTWSEYKDGQLYFTMIVIPKTETTVMIV